MKQDIYVVSACRTAIGSFGGSLSKTSLGELATAVTKEAMTRAEVAPDQVGEVIFGSVLTTGHGQNIARQALLHSEIPVTVPAYTINMLCGSGMKSMVEGAKSILMGDAEIVVTGGVESMSSAPYISKNMRNGAQAGDVTLQDTLFLDGLQDTHLGYHVGVTAENICREYKLTREELDKHALQSQQKAAKAQDEGRFEAEIVSIPVKVKRATVDFKVDEYLKKDVTLEGLAKLRPAFEKDGMVTPGNASGINDGGAALVLASGDAVKKYNLKPLAKLLSWGHGGVDPAVMGLGPVTATNDALGKLGLTVDDLDLVEASEAFAAQSIAVTRDLHFDPEKVNVNGGAIALGHPIGASGCRIVVTLLHEMRRRKAKTGLATLCIGGGMGIAAVFELVDEG